MKLKKRLYLYLDNSAPAEPTFSSLKHNLKTKFKKI